MSLRKVAALNALAVARIHHGYIDDSSKEALVGALHQLQSFCHEGSMHIESSQTFGQCVPQCFRLSPEQHLEDSDQIYDRAFLLSDDIPTSAISTCAVILFNLGLLHHKRGIMTGKSAWFSSALSFYSKAKHILESLTTNSITLAILEAALCHNKLQIYRHHLLLDQAKSATAELAVIVDWMALIGERVSQHVFEFFHTSASLSDGQDLLIAPAA